MLTKLHQPQRIAAAVNTIVAANPPAVRTLLVRAGAKFNIDIATARGRNSALQKLKNDSVLSNELEKLAWQHIVYEANRDKLADLRSDVEAHVLQTNPNLSGAALDAAVNAALTQDGFKTRFEALKKEIVPWEDKIEEQAGRVTANDTEKTQYAANVRSWLSNLQALDQLNRQNYEKVVYKISIQDVGPGDPYLRKESPPESLAHSRSLPPQNNPNLNGIADNRGDINVFHSGMGLNEQLKALMNKAALDSGLKPDKPLVKRALENLGSALALPGWKRENKVQESLDYFDKLVNAAKQAPKTGESSLEGVSRDELLEVTHQQIEMRGGLGTTNAMRALIQSFQTGSFWLYRAKPNMGLPEGEHSALIAKIFSNVQPDEEGNPTRKPLQYSTAILGGSMIAGDQLLARTAEGDHDAMLVAADPEKMPQEVDRASEFHKLLAEPGNEHIATAWKALTPAQRRDEATWPPVVKQAADLAQKRAVEFFTENAHYFEVRGKHRTGGETCATFLARAEQTAKLQEVMTAEFESFAARKREENPDITGKQIAEALTAEYGLPSGDELNTYTGIPPKVEAIWRESMKNFVGLLNNKPEGLAPKAVEHFLRGPEYEFVGVLTIDVGDVMNVEQNYDKKTGLPATPRYPFLANDPATHGATGVGSAQ